MEKLVRILALALMLVVAGAHIDKNVAANTITQLHDITMNGPNAVSYTFFTVTDAGVFNIFADGLPIYSLADPEIFLFTDNGSPGGGISGTFRGANDNSGIGPNPLNSLIANIFLDTGDYVVAVGAHVLLEQGARIDSNSTSLAGTVLVTVASEQGLASLQVPEPGSFILVGLGLLGLRFVRRRA